MECKEAIIKLLLRDSETSLYALDSFGKLPAGFLNGNFEWLGDYDECTSLEGLHYCNINFGLNSSSLGPPTPPVLELKYGICVPEVCSEYDVIKNIDTLIQLLPTEVSSYVSLVVPMLGNSPVNCQDFPQRPYDAGFICFTTFCLILAILMFLGTALDVFHRNCRTSSDNNLAHQQSYGSTEETSPLLVKHDDVEVKNHVCANIAESNSTSEERVSNGSKQSLLQEILLCFAFTRNLRKLLNTDIDQSQSIGCLHGIRVISIMWVALGHTYIFNLFAGPDNAGAIFENILPSFAFQAVGNAYSSVDTFFFMSGLLLTYLTMTRMAKSDGKISMLMFYFHRIWRLTPLYAFVILFVIYHHPFFGYGPKWFLAVYQDEMCEKFWWRNLLYINNFFSMDELCMQWSWYLSCDMQFFIISPLILIPLFRSRTIGLLIAITLICASLVVTGVLIGSYHFDTNTLGIILSSTPGLSLPSGKSYLGLVYFQPYARITPYILGMLMGYMIYRQVSSGQRIRLSPIVVSLGWALSFALGLSVIYGTYPSYSDVTFETTWNNATNVIYGTFSRVGWVVAVSWVVFACHYGYGGWVNDFLSWSFWTPLSRLTYSAYLLHGLVIQTYYFASPKATHISAMSSAYMFCGSLVISYAAAGLFSIAIEYPCAGLEKLMFRRKEQYNEDNKARHKSNGTTVR